MCLMEGGAVSRQSLLLFLSVLLLAGAVMAEEKEPYRYKNLKVLPADIPREELGEIMLDNLRGLGLPRLEGRGCLFCHVGSLDEPRASWDWASDEKPEKHKARTMMAMVREINQKYLPALEGRLAADSVVTCDTCHAGRTDPRPLVTLLQEAYDEGGIKDLSALYRELRPRYYGGDAYDFRPAVLSRLAVSLADRSLDDAIALEELNVEFNSEDPHVQQALLRLKLERTLEEHGSEAAVAKLGELAPELSSEVLTPSLLDSLGWRLRRTDRKEQALPLFLANKARFPHEYQTNESLAFITFDNGDREGAYRILEAWLEKHPDHDRARRLLVNLKAR